MAAAYVFHLTGNRPFVDGNKRIGVMAGLVFLRINGLLPRATDEELIELGLGVAQGQWNKERIAAYFDRVTQEG